MDFRTPEADGSTRNPKPLDITKLCVWIFLGEMSIAFYKGSVIHKGLRIITVEENSITAANGLIKHMGSAEI